MWRFPASARVSIWGSFSVEDFPATGTTTKFKPFNINLKNCSRGITGTKIWFTGTADSDDPSLLALTDTGMGNENMLASGIGVELLDEDQDDVSMNNSESVIYPLKAGAQYALLLHSLQIDTASGHLRQCDGGDVFSTCNTNRRGDE
ncbi:fimbrial protein BcfE [Klebsiella oxytoca]|nr:fimbrial protein BcfE [Klebsiella oxytoca]